MITNEAHQQAARLYADATRDLFARPAADGAPSLPALADRADRLLQLDDDLTRLTVAELAGADPDARGDAATRLLAKALVNLDVAAMVLEVAEAGEPAEEMLAERSVSEFADLEENLAIIAGVPLAGIRARRSPRRPSSTA